MKEEARLRFLQTAPELESGLLSIPEKPGRIFDEGENMVRIIRLPHDPENAQGQRYTVVPKDFATRLEVLSREEAIEALRAYAEERFREIQDVGIACSPRTISADVVVSDAAASTHQLLVATKKIANFRSIEKVGEIDYLTPEQQQQWYDDCAVLYGKLLTYYRAQRYARPSRPLMEDITRLRQYAYMPGAANSDERFVLLDVDVVVGTHKRAHERFLEIALDVLRQAVVYGSSNNIEPYRIDEIRRLEHEFEEELKGL